MAGKLFLYSTPIGNLGDIPPRVIETLESVDVIAVEDTRNSNKLLNHFNIKTPMTSYHEYNKVDIVNMYYIENYASGIIHLCDMEKKVSRRNKKDFEKRFQEFDLMYRG